MIRDVWVVACPEAVTGYDRFDVWVFEFLAMAGNVKWKIRVRDEIGESNFSDSILYWRFVWKLVSVIPHDFRLEFTSFAEIVGGFQWVWSLRGFFTVREILLNKLMVFATK